MKALPFPCIRPAQDRVLEALPAMGSILSGNDALRGAIADGLMLKDPGAAYYVYECSGEPGRVTGVVAICPVGALAAPPKRALRSMPSPTPPALRTACGRSSARTPSGPSAPCSTRRRSRHWPTTLPTLSH